MRGAAPVSIELRRSAGWSAAVVLLAAAAAGVVLLWAQRAAQPLVGVALAALAVACGVSLLRLPRGVLRWDGQHWWWRGRTGRIDAPIDLGAWMLLRFRAGRAEWLAVSAADAGADWRAFRAAVYCPIPPSSTADPHPARDV